MTEICIFYVCENNCLHFFRFIHTLIIIYIKSGNSPSPHLVNKKLDSKFKRQNTGVQHTKYRSTIDKVLRY